MLSQSAKQHPGMTHARARLGGVVAAIAAEQNATFNVSKNMERCPWKYASLYATASEFPERTVCLLAV